MALDIVKQITQIEKEGEEIVRKSQDRALQIQKESQVESQKIIEEAMEKSQQHYNSVIGRYEKEAEVLSNPIIEESQRNIDALGNVSEDLLNKAVNLVIERIVNSYGDS